MSSSLEAIFITRKIGLVLSNVCGKLDSQINGSVEGLHFLDGDCCGGYGYGVLGH